MFAIIQFISFAVCLKLHHQFILCFQDVVEKVPTSRYSGIPPSLFYCHVCKKHMWDDNVCIMDFMFSWLHFKHSIVIYWLFVCIYFSHSRII